MRKTLIALFLATSACGFAQSEIRLFGDFNNDGEITAEDVTHLVNIAIGKEKAKVIKSNSTIEILDYDPFNGHEYVDLGLPSGTLWATCNVGAEKPEDYGLYFAWGETIGYSQDISDGHAFNWANYKWCNGSENTLTKYCTSSDYGTVDNKTVLDLEDDAAHVNWGGSWRMPTKEELRELEYCTTKWEVRNGVYGYKVTGNNGNWIFLPAADCRYQTKFDNNQFGYYGYYWSNTLSPNKYGQDLIFTDSYFQTNGHYRYLGLPIRPVTK